MEHKKLNSEMTLEACLKKTFLQAIVSVFTHAQSHLDVAKKVAAENLELILLNFSGSDWCIPCIKLRKLHESSRLYSHHVFLIDDA